MSEIEVRAGVATIVFTPPRRCNAMTYTMISAQPFSPGTAMLIAARHRRSPAFVPSMRVARAWVGIDGVEPVGRMFPHAGDPLEALAANKRP